MISSRYSGTWPTLREYDKALQNRAATVYDLDIKDGKLERDATGPIHLNIGGGKYVCVYRVSNWVVRCFTGRPPSNLYERYRAISKYLDRHIANLPFLVPYSWVDRGIYLNGQDW